MDNFDIEHLRRHKREATDLIAAQRDTIDRLRHERAERDAEIERLRAENDALRQTLAMATAPSGAVFRADRPSYAQIAAFAAAQRDMFEHDEEADSMSVRGLKRVAPDDEAAALDGVRVSPDGSVT